MLQRGSHSGPKAQTAIRRSGKREVTPTASAIRFVGRPVRLHSGGTRLVLKIPTAAIYGRLAPQEHLAKDQGVGSVKFLPSEKRYLVRRSQPSKQSRKLITASCVLKDALSNPHDLL